MTFHNNCVNWGENRADEFFFDVGCVLGKSWCDTSKCNYYNPIKETKK